MASKLVRVVPSGAGLRRVNVATSGKDAEQPTWDTGAPDDRQFESVIQNNTPDPSCKTVIASGGGGGGVPDLALVLNSNPLQLNGAYLTLEA